MKEQRNVEGAQSRAGPTEPGSSLDESASGSPPEQPAPLLPGQQDTGTVSDPAPTVTVGSGQPAVDAGCLGFLEPPTQPGTLGRFLHYEVQEVLGQGGFGIVLEALDEKLQRRVAVKVLSPQMAGNATARQRFLREARAAAAVRHPHVVQVFAVAAEPLPHLVMEHVAGRTLQEEIDAAGPLPVAEVLRIGGEIAAGLAAAHALGLIHRDVKPSNILLEDGSRRVKLTDFGLAKAADDASLTESGAIAGTPLYMAPEQAQDAAVDHRADLFSLGSVLYTLCTGRPAFAADNTLAVLQRVCEDTPTSICEINPTLPDWLEAVVNRLLAKDPARRFPNAAEVAELLGGCLSHLHRPGAVPLPATLSLPERRSRRLRVAVLGCLLLAAAAAGVLLFHRSRPGTGTGEPPAPGELADPAGVANGLDRQDILPALLAQAGGGDPRQELPELVAVLQGHNGQVTRVAFRPDGRTLASSGDDATVRLWDVATRECRHTLTGHEGPVINLAFHPDGNLLASGGADGTVRLWEVPGGKPLLNLADAATRGHHVPVAFSPDGTLLASGSQGGGVKLWEPSTGALRRTLPTRAAVWCLAFSRDGRELAAGCDGNEIHFWDVADGRERATLQAPPGTAVRALAFHPQGQVLAAGSQWGDGTIRLWDLATQRVVQALPGHKDFVTSCLWWPDGRLLASAGATDGTVRLWEPAADPLRSRTIRVLPPRKQYLHEIALSPDGRHLATANPDGLIYILRLARRGEAIQLPDESERD